ncbi:hypothetical protein BH11BAC3_BH11BAC3_19760 [soil metagenome]
MITPINNKAFLDSISPNLKVINSLTLQRNIAIVTGITLTVTVVVLAYRINKFQRLSDITELANKKLSDQLKDNDRQNVAAKKAASEAISPLVNPLNYPGTTLAPNTL